MKKEMPTLEEAKEYFKDALEIRSNRTGWEAKINLETIRFYRIAGKDFIVCNCDNFIGIITLWCERDGFAEILSYKEPQKKTKLSELEKRIEALEAQIKKDSVITIPGLKPSDFVVNIVSPKEEKPVKLEYGRWISDDSEKRWIYFFVSANERYGIDSQGNWFHHKNCSHIEKYLNLPENRYSTESEVFEALKNEAVKRGYKSGTYVKYPWYEDKDEIFKIDMNEGHFRNVTKMTDDGFQLKGTQVFFEGQWAEIISSINKSEAEKQLGKKIID